jgi:DNA-binding NarL/FixJ family response regulator
MPHRIYVVEDHDEMREMLRSFLDMEEGFTVVGVAETAEEADAEVQGLDLDLLVIDVSLPGMSGIDLLERVRERSPEVRCLILSGHSEDVYVQAARRLGARGYVVKGQPDAYLTACRCVLDGETYRSDDVATAWEEAAEAGA